MFASPFFFMGRLKKIESPEKMWEYFVAYKKHTKDNPKKVTDWVGGLATEVERKKEIPLTLEGFENWCEDNDIISGIDQYFSNQNKLYDEYVGICLRIRRNIRQDQIEGGMAGVFNPSITQRLNSLTEKQDVTNTIKLGKELEDEYE